MCFDVSQLINDMTNEIDRFNNTNFDNNNLISSVKSFKNKAQNYYHVNGFTHPSLLVFCNKNNQLGLDQFSWGLIPHWVATESQAKSISNKTINARGETIFQKPSFRDAAIGHRIVIPLNGFYEHHHKKGKKLPYFIKSQDGRRLMLAGIASEWLDGNASIIKTFSIVTCSANDTMTFIHNNPKLKAPRMPLILDDENLNTWIYGTEEEVKRLIRPNSNIKLDYYTVRPIRGKNYKGNIASIQEKYNFAEDYRPPTLFD
ncbi:MAG: SOS response-associated peptidase [Saprospiraceae bacterium]|nr:SOS response-associated peptidase [Saprospiraceae bacterium]